MTFAVSIQLIKVIDYSKCTEYVMLFVVCTRVFSAIADSAPCQVAVLAQHTSMYALNRTCLCDVEKFGNHQIDIIHLVFRSRWFLANDERGRWSSSGSAPKTFGKNRRHNMGRIAKQRKQTSWLKCVFGVDVKRNANKQKRTNMKRD